MRFRMGAALGFAAGYVLGARAGRERYEQIRRTAEKAWGSQQVERVRHVAVSAAGDIGQKASEKIEEIRHRGDEEGEPVARAAGDGNGSVH